MSPLYSTVTLTIMSCGKCGVEFAMPETMRFEKKSSGGTWYCPNGHPRMYGESGVDEYKRLLTTEQREAAKLRERAIVAEHAQAKAEKVINLLKKRAAAGLCPCCNRTVSQLAAHMKTKHADFMELQGLAVRKQLPENVQ